MKTLDFYYDLPKELIAQDPLEDRSASRLMHLNKETGEYEHGHFRDILKYLKPGDCLVINDTKVIPAQSVLLADHSKNLKFSLVSSILLQIGTKGRCQVKYCAAPVLSGSTNLIIPLHPPSDKKFKNSFPGFSLIQ